MALFCGMDVKHKRGSSNDFAVQILLDMLQCRSSFYSNAYGQSKSVEKACSWGRLMGQICENVCWMKRP